MHQDNIGSFQQAPTPLQEVEHPVFAQQGIRLFIKRDDLLHPQISGNKWRKLKYNLLEANQLGFTKLLTFGGAYSNHLAATAAAGQTFGFSTLGVVRGEKVSPMNPTLKFAEMCGMELKFVSRTNFRNKNQNTILKDLKINPNAFYVIPEGGSNCFALQGVTESVAEILGQLGHPPDYLCTACGTGATLSGLIMGMQGNGHSVGIPVLKGGFMQKEVTSFLDQCGSQTFGKWTIEDGYHFGGYAKFKMPLIDFINGFKKQIGIPLDPIYTGKLAFALFDLAEKQFFKKGTNVVMLHTGGLQGNVGFNERFGNILE